jgi:hypothetical protein
MRRRLETRQMDLDGPCLILKVIGSKHVTDHSVYTLKYSVSTGIFNSSSYFLDPYRIVARQILGQIQFRLLEGIFEMPC